MKMLNKNIVKIIKYTLIGLISAAAIWLVFLFFSPFVSSQEKIDFIIHWGESFYSVSDRLESRKVIKSRKQLYMVSRMMGNTLEIKAGKYTLPLNSSNYRVMKSITGGQQSFIKVTIPEGFTAKRIASLVADTLQLNEQIFMDLVNDTSYIKSLDLDYPIANQSLEGYLFPETYNFSYGINEKQVIKQLVNQFFAHVPDSLVQLGKQYNFDLNALVTLASIIEGEAIIDQEKPIISSVYHNRLQKGMLLQADPAIQYIIPDGPRRILYRDLEIDSPYNTYRYAGLPPGPINNPGFIAIKAAAVPDTTSFYYFVADGKGGHVFSRTLTEHNNAKKEFNKIRRRVAREKRMGGVE